MKSSLTLTILASLASIGMAQADPVMPSGLAPSRLRDHARGHGHEQAAERRDAGGRLRTDRLRVPRLVLRGLRLEFPSGDRTAAQRGRSDLVGHQLRHVRGRRRQVAQVRDRGAHSRQRGPADLGLRRARGGRGDDGRPHQAEQGKARHRLRHPVPDPAHRAHHRSAPRKAARRWKRASTTARTPARRCSRR